MRFSRFSRFTLLLSIIMVAGLAYAQQPVNWSDVPPGTEVGEWIPTPSTDIEVLQTLTFWTNRTLFDAEFPGLPTEDWSGTSAGGGIVSCTPPLNASTNDACFTTGSVLDGIELNVNVVGGGGDYVVLGAGALGNVNVLVGPNSFADDLVFDFNPPIRAVGFDLVNPISPGAGSYTVDIIGTSGSLGTTTVVDGGEGNFWGVDTEDFGGITSIVFDGVGDTANSELTALVTFGGAPLPVELQTFEVE